MRQTLAIFLDAYRELNSKKLFWISLIISGLVVGVMGCIGINERGLTFLHWNFNFGPTTAFMSKASFYKQAMFVSLGVKIWLGLFASILALISTCTVIPDLIANGSVDLVLSKPLGRVRLFLTKYAASLLFVALQVTVFSVVAFLIIGIRGDAWEPRIFLAVPLVTLFFSYLFCVCALIGLLTRSAIASLLLTMLVWVASFLLTTADTTIAMVAELNSQRLTAFTSAVERKSKEIQQLKASPALSADQLLKLPIAENSLQRFQERKSESERWARYLGWAQNTSYGVKTVLPKVSETKDLLERVLLSDSEIRELTNDDSPINVNIADDKEFRVDEERVAKRMADRKLSQPLWWILGTSFVFEVFVLGICCWIFARRDF